MDSVWLKSKRIIITAGPTLESIKPIGFISSHATEKMGFALATKNALEHAKVKMKRKDFNRIVLNVQSEQDSGFVFDTNQIKIIDGDLKITDRVKESKSLVVVDYLKSKISAFVQSSNDV